MVVLKGRTIWLLLDDNAASVDGIKNDTTAAALIAGKSNIDFDGPISGQFQTVPPDKAWFLHDMP